MPNRTPKQSVSTILISFASVRLHLNFLIFWLRLLTCLPASLHWLRWPLSSFSLSLSSFSVVIVLFGSLPDDPTSSFFYSFRVTIYSLSSHTERHNSLRFLFFFFFYFRLRHCLFVCSSIVLSLLSGVHILFTLSSLGVVVIIAIVWCHFSVLEFIMVDPERDWCAFDEPKPKKNPLKWRGRRAKQVWWRSTVTQTLQCMRCIPNRQVVLRHQFILRGNNFKWK